MTPAETKLAQLLRGAYREGTEPAASAVTQAVFVESNQGSIY